jgi:hypothetical protein
LKRNAREFIELEKAITLTLYTKVPAKYILIDTETGQVYKGSDKGKWDILRSDNEYI